MAKSQRVAVRVDDETHRKLTDLAAAEERSISWYVERLIRAHLAALAAKK